MKTPPIRLWLLVAVLLLPAGVQAQFTFATNNGAITITGYTSRSNNVVIPSNTNGYPVTSIGDGAFNNGQQNYPQPTIPPMAAAARCYSTTPEPHSSDIRKARGVATAFPVASTASRTRRFITAPT